MWSSVAAWSSVVECGRLEAHLYLWPVEHIYICQIQSFTNCKTIYTYTFIRTSNSVKKITIIGLAIFTNIDWQWCVYVDMYVDVVVFHWKGFAVNIIVLTHQPFIRCPKSSWRKSRSVPKMTKESVVFLGKSQGKDVGLTIDGNQKFGQKTSWGWYFIGLFTGF